MHIQLLILKIVIYNFFMPAKAILPFFVITIKFTFYSPPMNKILISDSMKRRSIQTTLINPECLVKLIVF